MDIFPFIESCVQIIVPQPCFDTFFIEYDFLNAECLKATISKCLGFAIILGSLLVKVPQVVKIQRARSAEGINIISTSLEVVALIASLVYGYHQGFPFSAYGEAVFLLLQTAAVAFLVLWYGGLTGGAVIYLLLLSGALLYLLSPLAPSSLIWGLQASVMFNVIGARFIQAWTNFSNGHTGQLSAVTVFLLFFGSLARVFTSIQETGDPTIITTFLVSSFCNGVIAAQMLYYWSAVKEKRA